MDYTEFDEKIYRLKYRNPVSPRENFTPLLTHDEMRDRFLTYGNDNWVRITVFGQPFVGDGEGIFDIQVDPNWVITKDSVFTMDIPYIPKCEVCGNCLLQRNGRGNSLFLGCQNYQDGRQHTTKPFGRWQRNQNGRWEELG